ncbi:hypothetical protein PDR5_56170 [Pseudomonas sp. DR 5-09]|nr:hypothetical protein PDR5_56170 [Pseudomonas sp. DR 5-09]
MPAGGSIKCNPCGSEPARDSVGTFNIRVSDPPQSRAGSLPQETMQAGLLVVILCNRPAASVSCGA